MATNQFVDNLVRLLEQSKGKLPTGADAISGGLASQRIDKAKNYVASLKGRSIQEAYGKAGAAISQLDNAYSAMGITQVIFRDYIAQAVDNNVNRHLNMAGQYGQMLKSQQATKPADGQVAGKETEVDRYAKLLQQKWGRVFKRRDLNGFKRYIQWRMDNMNMNPQQSFDDLNRLWSKRYGGRRSKQQAGKEPADKTQQKQPPAPPAPPPPPSTQSDSEKAKEETETRTKAEEQEYWMKKLQERGGTMRKDELADLKSEVFKSSTGTSLGSVPIGYRNSIEQFFNIETNRLKNQYEERAMKDVKQNKDPFNRASTYMRNNLAKVLNRVGLTRGQGSVEQFVNNWNKYRTEYGSYEGIRQPRRVVDNQGRTQDRYFQRRPS